MLNKLIQAGEYSVVGLMEEPERSLFYRKALSIRRFYEHCHLAEYTGKPLYPSGVIDGGLMAGPHFLNGVDRGLMPYYQGKNIVPLLQNLFDNLNEREGYSMALGKPSSPLTEQCLIAAEGKRRPMIELFVDQNTPDYIWNAALRLVRSGGGQPAFYNPDVLLNGLQKRFPSITDADIQQFCGGGCTESMIAGMSNVGSLDAGINLLLILEEVLKTKLPEVKSFDELYDHYIAAVRDVVDSVATEIFNSQKQRAEYNPVPMRTLLVDDCIDNRTEYYAGGARYCWSVVNFAGTINVIDALMAVKKAVLEQKSLTAEALLEGLSQNDAALLKQLRENPYCFGVDNEEVNQFGHRLTETIFGMLRDKKTYYGEGFLPSSIQFLAQVEAGKGIGATPDGRESGAPLCDSLGAIFGKDGKGPTALLKSVTSLDLKQALGAPVLNFNINPGFKDEVLKGLILGYMSLGGIQMQITCISAEQLQEAYENPELHKNIVVRVGGYSEYFSRLSDELKRMVINRTIQNEV